MKRIICLILLAILIIAPFAGVTAEEQKNFAFSDQSKRAIDISEILSGYSAQEFPTSVGEVMITGPNSLGAASGGRYYYSLMEGNDLAQYVYEVISDYFEAGEAKSYVEIDLVSPSDDINSIREELDYVSWRIIDIMALYAYDNPEDTEFCGVYMQVSYVYDPDEHKGLFWPEYVAHPQYKDSYKTNRDKFVNEVAGEAQKLSGDYAKIKYAHDAVINAAECDLHSELYADISSEEYFLSRESFGITERGKSGSAGYAKMFKQILDKLGYENMLAMNDAKMWNVVKVSGKWYIVDCVMDDQTGSYVYFLAPEFDTIHQSDDAPEISAQYYSADGVIRSVLLNGRNMYAGEKVSEFSVPEGSNFVIVSQQWTEKDSDTHLSNADVFKADKTYEYAVVIKANSSYIFDENLLFWLCATANGTGNVIISENGTMAECVFELIIPEKLDSISLGLKTPIPGKALPTADISSAERIVISEEFWIDDDTGEIVSEVIAGKVYIYVITVTAAEGYAIVDDVIVNVDGIEWEDSVTQIQSVAGDNIVSFAGLTTVEEHIHTEKTVPGKDASCTEDGLTEGKVCESCGEILKEQKVIPGGHKLTVKVEGNIKSTSCTKCDYEESHELTEEEIAFFGAGDINYDGIINSTDLSDLLSSYGTTNVSADIKTDGVVNSGDLSELLSNYGKALKD